MSARRAPLLDQPPTSAVAAPARRGLAATFAALRHRNFRLLWIGLLVSNSGSWMQVVAQGWLVQTLTDSPFYLGLVGFARAIPLLTLSVIGGTVADRVDRRKLLYVSQTVQAVLAFLLAGLTVSGRIQMWQILAIAFGSAAALAFDQPTRQALVPSLLPREDLLNGIALNSMVFNGAAVFGPTLAGLAVPLIGLGGAFVLNAVSFGAVIVALAMMRLPPQPPRTNRTRLATDVLEGFQHAKRSQIAFGLLLLAASVALFARNYTLLMSEFAKNALGRGVVELGYLQTAAGAGTVLGALALASFSGRLHKGRSIFLTALGLGLSLVAFSLTRALWAALAALVVVGALNIMTLSTINTMLQLSVEDRLRGRVMSLFTVSVLGLVPLGALPFGALAEVVGLPASLATGAGLLLLATWLIAWKTPRIRQTP